MSHIYSYKFFKADLTYYCWRRHSLMSIAIFSVAQIVKLLQSPRRRVLWEQKCHNKMWGKDLRKRNVLSCWRKIGDEGDDWMSSSFSADRSPAYSETPAHRPSIGTVRMPMERGRELVGVCGMCATCGRGRLSRHVCSLSGIYYSACQGVAYCLTSLAGTLQRQPTSACSALAPADACAALPEASHVYQLGPRQRKPTFMTLRMMMPETVTDFLRTPSNPLLPARDYLPDDHVHRNYYEIRL